MGRAVFSGEPNAVALAPWAGQPRMRLIAEQVMSRGAVATRDISKFERLSSFEIPHVATAPFGMTAPDSYAVALLPARADDASLDAQRKR